MPFTHAERSDAQRDAHTDLYALGRARRAELLRNQDVSQYEEPIKEARMSLLQVKAMLELDGLEEEPRSE